jgi:hypothetical protein
MSFRISNHAFTGPQIECCYVALLPTQIMFYKLYYGVTMIKLIFFGTITYFHSLMKQ